MAGKRLPARKYRGGLASAIGGFHLPPMTMSLTLILLAAFAGLTLFAGWRGSLPPNLVKGPRMIPWRPLMVCAAAATAMVGAHLAALLGFAMNR